MSVSDEKVKEHIAKDIRANAARNPEVDDLGELLTNYAESQQCECGGTKYLVDDTVECPRALNFDPPCALNFDPGVIAARH